jgi:hypothetical protein
MRLESLERNGTCGHGDTRLLLLLHYCLVGCFYRDGKTELGGVLKCVSRNLGTERLD